MLTAQTVLAIIEESLKLANTLAESMTPEQRQALWARHDARMQFWEQVLSRFREFTGDAPDPREKSEG